jgi:hypothetical protein
MMRFRLWQNAIQVLLEKDKGRPNIEGAASNVPSEFFAIGFCLPAVQHSQKSSPIMGKASS